MRARGLVLCSLAGGPKHGYALIDDIRSSAGVTLGPATLYGCLTWLEEQGMIEALPGDDRRRAYRITPTGARRLPSLTPRAPAPGRPRWGRLGPVSP